MKILVLLAHPAIQHSRTNRLMLEAAHRIEGVSIVDLYGLYPRFDIDIDGEQQRLLEHDVVLFQFPLYWYSTPALLKEWIDLVLEHGFAYGESGVALKDKPWVCAITAGAPEQAYGPDGHHGAPLRQLLAPLEATARLCHMPFLAPFVFYGSQETTQAARWTHVEGYSRLLTALRDARLDLQAAQQLDILTVDRLDLILAA